MIRNSHGQRGFTIIELLIASSVFSVILLVCTAALLRVGQIYYKGIITSRTQETTRDIVESIANSLQFNGGTLTGPLTLAVGAPVGNVYGFCIDNHRYSYILDKQLTDGTPDTTHAKHVFVVDDVPGGICSAPQNITGGLTGSSRELLGLNMRLGAAPMPTINGNLYTVALEVAYGEDDLLIKTGALPNLSYSCSQIRYGGQFCAVSQLTTTVEKRVQ